MACRNGLLHQVVEGDEQPPPFILLSQNFYRFRRPKQVKNDDVAVCECEPPASSSGAAGCHVDSCLNALLCTECTPGFCPCGDACRNQRFQRCEHARTVVKKVKGRGWGLVAAEPIKAGQFVIEYCGEVVPNKEAQRRHAAYLAAGEKNVYLLKLNAREVIDPTKMGAAARFVNHSCDPNCETRKWTVLGEIRVGIFARKDIEPGCELTYDYDYEWYGGDKVKCRCGAAACVGFLGAKSRAFQEDTYLWVDDDGRFEVEDVPLYDTSSEDSEYNDDEEEEEGEEEEGEEEEGEEEVRVGGRETREGAEEAGKEGKAEGKGERQAELVERKGVGRRVGKGGSKDVSGAGEGDVKVGGEQEEQEAEEEEKEVWVSRGGEGYGAEEWQEWMENDSEGWEEEEQEEEGGSVADLTQDGDEEEVGEGAGMSDGGGYEGQEGEGAERMQEGEEGGEGGEGGGIKARGLKRKARKPRVKRPGIPKGVFSPLIDVDGGGEGEQEGEWEGAGEGGRDLGEGDEGWMRAACSFSGKRPIMPLGPGQAR
ncbi:unnamed protein product [Closterium sp. NIES-64]|nr:unnamed protein product [Closterium sp. NIES-64]